MAETTDPVRALAAPDIPTRSAGARDLAESGGREHLPVLVRLAVEDPSTGVRLHAAGAAADILSRHRSPSAIPAAERDALFRPVMFSEPGLNPGLFQVAGEINTRPGMSRILGGMRDPRVDVRVGAGVGLLRRAQQGQHNGDAELERQGASLVGDARIKPETRVDLAALCAALGWTSALAEAEALLPQLTGRLVEVMEEAIARLREPGPVTGLWAEAGRDAGELSPERRGAVIAVIGQERGGADGRREPITLPIRRMYLKERGWDSPGAVLQIGAQTFYPAEPEEALEFADAGLERFGPGSPAGSPEALAAWAGSLEACWPEGAVGGRIRGRVLLKQGRAAEALEVLQGAVDAKRAPVDTAWWLAEALAALGRGAEARPFLERFVAKAARRSPWLAEAKQRLG